MDKTFFLYSNRNFTLMRVYGLLIGQVPVCPGKCHQDKRLDIPLEIIGTKYKDTHSCLLEVEDIESLPLPRCTIYIL